MRDEARAVCGAAPRASHARHARRRTKLRGPEYSGGCRPLADTLRWWIYSRSSEAWARKVRHRNATHCGMWGHTCDLHRQDRLIRHYVYTLGAPTLLWDKYQQLAPDDPFRTYSAVTVCEESGPWSVRATRRHVSGRCFALPGSEAWFVVADSGDEGGPRCGGNGEVVGVRAG